MAVLTQKVQIPRDTESDAPGVIVVVLMYLLIKLGTSRLFTCLLRVFARRPSNP
jgi:hypothetical protein